MEQCDIVEARRAYQREYMRRRRADPEYREQEQAQRRARRAQPGYRAAAYIRARARRLAAQQTQT